jgi:DNA topoisomerase-1
MGKNLVVVESPAKAKTLSRYLGKDYVVTASKGHVKDLPTKELGVDIGAGFVPQYVPMRGKGALLKEICKLGKSADTIYLAPDPDREGEAIAWHIAEELRSGKQQPKNVYRVLITEITKNGVKDAFTRPLQLNENRYNSQQARRILDRLVGYQLSPLLWDKVRRGLSAGRVQSVAVRLIVDREREIAAFQPVEYWKIEVNVEGQTPPDFWARLHRYKGEEIPVGDGTHAAAVVEALEAADYVITRVERKERRRQPQPPFITSTLQQDAIRKLHMNAKRTMQVAQKLYEGIPLGEEGPTGLITYMRTDSTRVSDQAIDGVRAYIGDRYSARHLPVKPRTFAKSKKAQDAHEAIRPSDVNRTPDSVKAHLNRDQFRLYQLIWRRFVASQMADALYDGTSVDIQAGDYTLRATGSVLTFAGWLDVYTEADDEDQSPVAQSDDNALPILEEGQRLEKREVRAEQKFTKPPPRFTEATLVKELESQGIGRPSTYASIISTIQDKGYVEWQERRFFPTELGMVVTDLLVESFPDVLNTEFTAEMEDELDKIEEGTAGWVEVLSNFYEPFRVDLDKARKEMRDLKREAEPTDIACEKCGSQMVIRWGKNGSFLACSAYPECKSTQEFKREDGKIVLVQPEVAVSGVCDKCGADMVIKTGKFGRFRACSRYPECKNTAPVGTGVTCPDCSKGELVEKRSRRGKIFFGCNRYPDCKHATWDRPVPVPCPHCDSQFLLSKVSRDGTERLSCPVCKAQISAGESDYSADAP